MILATIVICDSYAGENELEQRLRYQKKRLTDIEGGDCDMDQEETRRQGPPDNVPPEDPGKPDDPGRPPHVPPDRPPRPVPPQKPHAVTI